MKEIIQIILLAIIALFFLVCTGCSMFDQKTIDDRIALQRFNRYEDSMRPREQYVNAHPELTAWQKECVLKGEAFIGMSEDAFTATFGQPNSIGSIASPAGALDQFNYGRSAYFFQNGNLNYWIVNNSFP